MPLPSIDRLTALSDATLERWVAAMRAGGFHHAAYDAVGGIAAAATEWARRPMTQWRLDRHPKPELRLTLLLGYGGSLPDSEAERLLGSDLARELREAGALRVENGTAFCPFRITPFCDLYLLADHTLDQPDTVMPPGPTTERLASCMPARSEGSMLDIGCGPGGLALVAAQRGSRRAVGTDITERAVEVSRFNARLNRLDAEFLVGDLAAPVANERFDLVVSQPPFILKSPGSEPIAYLHGGPRGDSILIRLLRGVAASLRPGGEALVLGEVPLGPGEDLRVYLERELGSIGADLMVLHCAAVDLETHSLIYASYEHSKQDSRYIEAAQRHVAQFESMGIVQLRHSLFVVRPPREGAATLRTVALPVRATEPGPRVHDRLWAAIEAADLPDKGLGRRQVRVSPEAQWVSRRAEPEGDWSEHRVTFGPGWPALEQIVTDEGIALASLLQRSPCVDDAVAGYAEACDCAAEEVRAPVLRWVRDGLNTGLLVVEEEARG
jgi:methylase of polypeptide subunit release factors